MDWDALAVLGWLRPVFWVLGSFMAIWFSGRILLLAIGLLDGKSDVDFRDTLLLGIFGALLILAGNTLPV